MNFGTAFFHRLLSAGLSIGLLAIIVAGCDKNDKQAPPPTAPFVSTAALTNVTSSSATAGGSIVSDGGDTVTASGVVWSKANTTPTLADSVVNATATSGAFTVDINGIDFDNTYYFRAFATNSAGTGYGDVVTLTTSGDSVRFTYNGQEVTYGIIVSSVTGKKWLDRNLGAQQVATAFDDYKAYGDLFQWGRPADGHQLIDWTSSTQGTPVNGTVYDVTATSDNPDESRFIFPPYDIPLDWRSDNNNNRWATTPQGPCPAGWHVPSIDEWLAEVSNTKGGTANSGGMTNGSSAYNQLKLVFAGFRIIDAPGSVVIIQSSIAGHYWSTSEIINNSSSKITQFNPIIDGIQAGDEFKAQALSVRCLKDN
jgi:uncharacterized protein (TIGR02145 family)